MSIARIDSASAGAISRVAIARSSSGGTYLTAVRDSDENLKVIAWEIALNTTNGNIVRRGDATAGQISEVAIAEAAGRIVTAVRDSNGNLKLIAWQLTAEDDIVRRADASAGAISEVAITELSLISDSTRYATAVINSDGNLQVIIWEIVSNDNDISILRRGSASTGTVREISIAPLIRQTENLSRFRFATAVRNSDNNLQVIVWHVTPNGGVVRIGDAVAGQASLISAARVNDNRLLTAVRDSSNNLKIIVWDIDYDGNLTRRGSALAGAVSLISIMSSNTTAVRDSDGNLKLIDWNITLSGDVSRGDSALAGAADLIAADSRVTAVRDSDGNLKLINWQTT